MYEKEDIEELKKILGKNLTTLAGYNNGDEAKCLAICNILNIDIMEDLKKTKISPIIFTKDEIKKSIDTFPVEFLNIKKNHKILYGEDIFEDIEISREGLKRQLEFESRSKLIHLRQSYLKSKDKDLDNIIMNAVPTLAPIIGALMYLKNIVPKYDPDLIKIMIGLDTKVVMEIYKVRSGKSKLKRDKNKYVERLINLLTQIGDIVDKIEINEKMI